MRALLPVPVEPIDAPFPPGSIATATARLRETNVMENEAPLYSALTSYPLAGKVIHDHRLYESLQAANLGHAVNDPAWWLDLGPTNAWAMFDQSNGSVTQNAEEIVVEFQLSGSITGVCFLNLSASSIRVEVKAQPDGGGEYETVYDETWPMVSNAGINNWYDYFFTDIAMYGGFLVDDLPRRSSMRLRVTLNNPGSIAALGNLIVGPIREIGGTEMGARTGIIDFSRKGADDFGAYTIVERAYAQRANFRIWVERNQTDAVSAVLADYRAKPALWLGSDTLAATVIYGFLRDWAAEISYPTYSIFSAEIEGLS